MKKAPGRILQAHLGRLPWLYLLALGITAAGASLLVAPSTALGSPGTSVETQSVTLTTGGTGQANVTVKEVPAAGFGMYQVTVSYNKNVVTVSSVSGGNSPYNAAPSATINNTAGTVTIEKDIAPSGPTSGDQVVAKLNLQAVGTAGQTTALTVSVGFLHDNLHNTLSGVTVTNGTVTLQAPPPTIPAVSVAGLAVMAVALGMLMLFGGRAMRRRWSARGAG